MPQDETPIESPSPGADAHSDPGHGATSGGIKSKIAAFFAKVKERVSARAATIPRPQVDSASVKAAGSAFLRDVVTLPALLWTGDGLTRIAVVGFVLSATLLVIMAPQALQVVLHSTTGIDIPGISSQKVKSVAPAVPRPAPLKTLGPVAYLGELQGEFAGGGTFSLEIFLEFENEEEAAQVRAQEEKTRSAVLAVFQKLTREDWVSEEGRKESLAALAAAVTEVTATTPQRVLITKETLTTRENVIE